MMFGLFLNSGLGVFASFFKLAYFRTFNFHVADNNSHFPDNPTCSSDSSTSCSPLENKTCHGILLKIYMLSVFCVPFLPLYSDVRVLA